MAHIDDEEEASALIELSCGIFHIVVDPDAEEVLVVFQRDPTRAELKDNPKATTALDQMTIAFSSSGKAPLSRHEKSLVEDEDEAVDPEGDE